MGCRRLVSVLFEMPIRDQAEKLRGSWAQGPGVQVQAGQMSSGVRVLMVFQATGQDEVPEGVRPGRSRRTEGAPSHWKIEMRKEQRRMLKGATRKEQKPEPRRDRHFWRR